MARISRPGRLELSVAVAESALSDAGLITAEKLERTLIEMQRRDTDQTVLAAMWQLTPEA